MGMGNRLIEVHDFMSVHNTDVHTAIMATKWAEKLRDEPTIRQEIEDTKIDIEEHHECGDFDALIDSLDRLTLLERELTQILRKQII